MEIVKMIKPNDNFVREVIGLSAARSSFEAAVSGPMAGGLARAIEVCGLNCVSECESTSPSFAPAGARTSASTNIRPTADKQG